MADKIIGPTGSPKRRRFVLLALLVVSALGLFWIAGAQAVHNTGAFELDGDATSENASPPVGPADDWDRVCHEVLGNDCSTSSDTSGATAVSWTAEPDLNATIFTGGGSKDPIDVDQWAWKDGAGGLPDKDNLLHGFAARYELDPTAADGTCPNGTGGPGQPAFDSSINCVVLYFGSDRYDNSGDAQQGFWFFQNPIGFGTNSIGGGTGFTGVHANGDVLVISDFSNGGTTATITVYKWDSTCTKGAVKPNPGDCGDANLRLLSTSANAKCAGTLPANDNACGIVNPGTTTLPWSFTDKSGTANNGALNGEFFEAGINLSTLGLAGECFSSVASESRASTSTTATLKDFILGQFAVCKPSMDTNASTSGSVQIGTAVHDTATITVTGATSPDDPTGDVSFFLCGPAASKALAACTTGGADAGTNALDGGANTTDGIASADSDDVNTAASPLAPGFYCFRAEWPGDTNYPGALSFTNTDDECFEVTGSASLATAQRWLPNDTAHVTSQSGTTLAGTVTFTLYNDDDCGNNGGTSQFSQTKNVVTDANPGGTANDRFVSTTNTTFFVTTANDAVAWSWKVSYDDNVLTDPADECETTTPAFTLSD